MNKQITIPAWLGLLGFLGCVAAFILWLDRSHLVAGQAARDNGSQSESIAPRLLEYLTLRAQCKSGAVEQNELAACVIMVNEAMRQRVVLECATNAVIASAFKKDKGQREPRKLSLDTASDHCKKMWAKVSYDPQ